MSAANATPMKIFKSLAANEEIYGEIAYDSAMIYRDITLLGMDLITAIKHAVDGQPPHGQPSFSKEWSVPSPVVAISNCIS